MYNQISLTIDLTNMTLTDIIYHLEITEHEDLLDLNEKDCIKASLYLISNLNEYHTIPGDVYYQFIGIINWYEEKKFITDKQHYWLLVNLWKYIDQREYTMQEMM